MLIVEGRTDEPAYGAACEHGDAQVFSAGTRDLVEQMLVLAEHSPIDGCECVYLVDCDGRGKTAHLSDRDCLVVTETCDLESDLVKIGVAERVVARFLPEGGSEPMIKAAVKSALPFSRLRRAAHRLGVSMKQGGLQVRLADLPEPILRAWESTEPTNSEAVQAVSVHLGWDEPTRQRIEDELDTVSRSPDHVALGKDLLDALFRLLQRDGVGDVRGWSRDHFHRVVRRELRADDFPGWVVGQRLARWSEAGGLCLLRMPE